MARRVLLLLFLATALPLFSAQKSFVMHLVPLSEWQLVSSRQVTLRDLEKVGCQPAVDREFGANSAIERDYERNGISVTAFFEEAADPSSAYGLYTFYQKEGARPLPGLELTVVGHEGALMARGRYFIRVLKPSSANLSWGDFRSLLIAIGGARLSVENAEKLPQTLPTAGLVPGTEKYLLGNKAAERILPSFPVNLIGLGNGVEALVGIYNSGGERLRFLAVNYPTPQLARLKYNAMQDALHFNTDHGRGSIYAKLQGSYALLVLDARSSEAANRLLDQFKISQMLTWSPPYHSDKSTAYQLVTLILANFELIAIIVILGVIGGISMFVCKRLIIRFFPQSAIAKAQEGELTRLKLS